MDNTITTEDATKRFRVSIYDGDESFDRYYQAKDRDAAISKAVREFPEYDINSATLLATGYLNVFHVGQAYGGPEEGGWYYTRGALKCAIDIDGMTEGEACALERLLRISYPASHVPLYSVLSEGTFEFERNPLKGEDYPKYKPHYE